MRQRFFAKNHFSRFCGCDRDGSVTVIGCADVDGIDIVPGDQRLPVRLGALVSPLAGKSLGALAISAANGLEYGAIGKVSKKSLTRL